MKKNTTENGERAKVSFIVAGAQKGGTSAIDKYLRNHAGVAMASRKEVHFFDRDSYFKKRADYAAYHGFFKKAAGNKLRGESTPIYMYWYTAPKRIWRYNPDMKLIFILRNPIERAYSHWNMEREKGVDTLSFWDAITQEQERCRASLPGQDRVYSYVDRGFYTEQLRRIWHFFPKEQTLVIKSEDLRYKLPETLERVSSFIGIDPFEDVEPKIVHARPYVSTMEQREREFLKEKYLFEIKELERLLGWDCSEWLK